MKLENIILKEKKPITKGFVLCDSIYEKCPVKAKPQRQDIHGLQETDWRRGEWEVITVGEVSFSGEEMWN